MTSEKVKVYWKKQGHTQAIKQMEERIDVAIKDISKEDLNTICRGSDVRDILLAIREEIAQLEKLKEPTRISKRDKIYRYEPQEAKEDFKHIFDAFIWLCNEVNKLPNEE